jgi:chemotaxis protein CheD
MNQNFEVTHPWLAHFFDPHFLCDVVKIKPGEYFATSRVCIIATVLGSCVAACIEDPVRGRAGMNHFMLPRDTRIDQEVLPRSVSLRYGISAMDSLIDEFVKHGSLRRDLRAKVFGGSSVMQAMQSEIGKQNSVFVARYLADQGIPIDAVDLGGVFARKVLLFVETGRVLVKYLSRLTNDTIEQREAEYARKLRDTEYARALHGVE